MDYIGYECPVCKKPFHAYEDIVVCPECGTPHHRECFDNEGHCHFEDKHGSGYEFGHEKNVETNNSYDNIKCKFCGTENRDDSLFCKKCGNPLQENSQQTERQRPVGMPFNPYWGSGQANGSQSSAFDANMNPDEEFAQGVKAGEIEKFVKTSTPYYMHVFRNIKYYSRSRFSFSAFLFSGGFLLYRKQYKYGSIITIIMAALIFASTFVLFSADYQNAAILLENKANIIATGSYMDLTVLYYASNFLSQGQLIIFTIPPLMQIIQLVIKFYIGFTANRTYYNFCINEVKKIKTTAKDQYEANNLIESKGGVNTALAISLFVAYVILVGFPMAL